MRKILSPALVLFFLSPLIAELLTGSSPPLQFFNPIVLALLCGLYGTGAIIARELTHRWGKGLPTLVTLGAAYGIVEEGLMVKSFFDPGWQDLGVLASYGRWAGVNWVWAFELAIFHAVFSIAIPVLLVNLMFPARRSEPWVSRRILYLLGTALTVDVLVGLFLFPYGPPPVQYLLAVIAVASLVWLAKRLPHPLFARKVVSAPSALRFGLAGFLGTMGFFLVPWLSPYSGLPAALTIIVYLAYCTSIASILLRMSGNGASWSEKHQLALAGGALGFLITLAPLHEVNKTQPENMAGMTLVALAFIALLAFMAVQLKRNASVRTQTLCPSCGVAALPDAVYCHECGRHLSS